VCPKAVTGRYHGLGSMRCSLQESQAADLLVTAVQQPDVGDEQLPHSTTCTTDLQASLSFIARGSTSTRVSQCTHASFSQHGKLRYPETDKFSLFMSLTWDRILANIAPVRPGTNPPTNDKRLPRHVSHPGTCLDRR
jgi:hypothetical protein